eukprot:3441543-Pyramimonas_sp.AAC.1
MGGEEWDRPEGVPALEARAVLSHVRHALSAARNHGKRHLVSGDSSATVSASRTRARTRTMLRVTRKIGGLALATGSAFSLRWTPSEFYVA